MIDINELRRLAQAATPGPWKAGQYLGSLRQFVIHTDVGDKGRGSDVAFTSAAFGNDETVANARIIAAANPAAVSELLDRLEAAEKNNSAWLYANAPGGWIDNLRVECEALRARIAQVDRQEPVAWMCSDKALIQMGYKKFSDRCEGEWDIPVFAGIPGAKGEEK